MAGMSDFTLAVESRSFDDVGEGSRHHILANA
jgi:hypothetical protein